MAKPTNAPAGWYPHPDDADLFWYWDGQQYVGAPQSREQLYGPAPVPEQQRRESPIGAVAELGSKFVAFAGRRSALEEAQQEIGQLRARVAELEASLQSAEDVVKRYGLDADQAREKERVLAIRQLDETREQIAQVQDQLATLNEEYGNLANSLIDLRSVRSLQSLGLYNYEHPAESSVALADELEQVRSRIKDAISRKIAATAAGDFRFNNSSASGQKFVKDMTGLLLRAYNAEAENCVKGAKAGNYEANLKRLNTARAQIEKLGAMISLRISPEFHSLRLREIDLATMYLQVLAEEKAAEREQRAQLREDARVAREIEREMRKLSENRQMLESALAAAEANGDQKAAEMARMKLEDVRKHIDDVNARAANRRMGHVYVISNLGAFGDDIVKIGMTRRLEPLERVRELGDASVPFRFDVHAIIFSEDAVGLETMLHQKFADRRVNRVNTHREFFRVRPSEVLEALNSAHVIVKSFTVDSAAEEYRASIGEMDTDSLQSSEDSFFDDDLTGEDSDGLD